MTAGEALQIIHSRGLYVSAGPSPRIAKGKRRGSVIWWVVAAMVIDTERGIGETIAQAVESLIEQEKPQKVDSDDELF